MIPPRLVVLVAATSIGMSTAVAAPVVPNSALPGRERDRFLESPLDRYMQPSQQRAAPLIEWDCSGSKSRRSKQRAAKNKIC
jgi:hypothetical protein